MLNIYPVEWKDFIHFSSFMKEINEIKRKQERY